MKNKEEIKSVNLEDLVAAVIMFFCEYSQELGYTEEQKNKSQVQWFLELPYEEMVKVADKLLVIASKEAETNER